MNVNRIKIFFIFNGYASKNKSITGGETRSVTLAKYLNNQGHEVSFCCPENFHIAESMIGLKSHYYSTLPFEEKFYDNLAILFLIYCYRVIACVVKIFKSNPDILVSTSHLFPDVLPLLFLKKINLNSTVIIHHILSEQKRTGLRSKLAQTIEKFCFYIIKKKKSFILTLSENTKEMLINKYGFEDSKIYVTKNGLDLSFINSIKTHEDKKYDIGFCGRLSKTKGVYDLVKIMKLVSKVYPKVSCVVIGDGDERKGLELEIESNNLGDNIKLLGFLDEKDKIETLKSSKIFVLPSHEEGWGMVIGEAMACGLPVIVYRLMDIIKIWSNNVIWVDCFNIESFSENIVRLLNDQSERETFSKKSLEFSKTLGWDFILRDEMHVILENYNSNYL